MSRYWNDISQNVLYHHGILGQKWGVRRFQNEDGSLTPAGEKRYNDSLTNIYENVNDNDDFKLNSGTTVSRRTSSQVDDDLSKTPYAYVYDYDNERDNDFYTQFGKKVTDYTLINDSTLAGKKTLGKAFADKMMSLDGSNDEDTMDTLDILYNDVCKSRGKEYVDDLFSVPFDPKNHSEDFENIGSDMISRMISSQRHDAKDEKLKKRGMRDITTLANDMGREFVNDLINNGYSGMRDYNDFGSNANVTTPTIMFNPTETMAVGKSWLDEILKEK